MVLQWRRPVCTGCRRIVSRGYGPVPFENRSSPVEPDHLSEQSAHDTTHELTLVDVARVIVARWKTILGIVVGVVVITLVWSWRTATYRGEGVLQMPTVSLADYKRYSIALLDGPSFIAFLDTRKDFSPGEIDRVRATLPTGDGVSPWARPAFGFGKGDVKDVPDPGKMENQFVGADIQVETRSAEIARKLADAVGDYVGDAMVRGRVLDFVGTNLNDTRIALGKLENESLQNQFLLVQQQKRLADMRDINRRYPEASRESPRQVVSLDKGGARFFSPVAQVVGVESYIAEINETVRKLARDREKLETDLAYLTLARNEIEKAPLGRQKLSLLESAIEETRRTRDVSRDAVRESFNTAMLNVGQIRYLAGDGLRFVSPPVVREPHYGRVLATAAAAAAVAGLLLAALVALVLAWGKGLRAPKSGV